MNRSLDDFSLSFLLDELVEAGLPKSIAERSDFLPSLILGTEGVDSLTGTEGRDYIFGLAGDDLIEGLGGNDFLFSGEGDNIVRGGDGRDRIYGKTGADQLFGNAGDDRFRDISGGNEIDGGEGRDTVNYRNVNKAIALSFKVGDPDRFPNEDTLQIEQADLTADKISNIERIIAPAGQANSIDFQDTFFLPPLSGPSATAPAIDVNLGTNTLNTFIDGEEVTITVENFVDVIGSINDDIIIGNQADNNLDGNLGDNVLEGGRGNDTLSTFENDFLLGGSGSDTFTLKAADKTVSGFVGPFPPVIEGLQASEILDFQTDVDKIQLNREGQTAQSSPGFSVFYRGFREIPLGQLDPDLFRIVGSSDAPSSAHLAYNNNTGDLFYRVGSEIDNRIAAFSGAPDLAASDFVVV